MVSYDVSPDGRQVVYASVDRDGRSQLWVAPIDRSSPARQIGHSGETLPHFGPRGQILFRLAEGNFNYLEQMNQDGSGRSKVLPYPIIEVQGISPGRRWLMAIATYSEGNSVVPKVVAIPLDGGPPRNICASYCLPEWSSSGRYLFVPVEASSPTTPGRSLAIPVGPGEELPELPPEGIQPLAEPSVIPGAQSINRAELVPGIGPLTLCLREHNGAPKSVSHLAALRIDCDRMWAFAVIGWDRCGCRYLCFRPKNPTSWIQNPLRSCAHLGGGLTVLSRT